MAQSPSEPLHPSRRAILTGATAGLAGLLVPVVVDRSQAVAAPVIHLASDGIQLDVDAAGVLTFKDGNGVDRITVQHFMIKDEVLGQQRTYGGTPVLVTAQGGGQAAQITYAMAGSASAISVVGTIELTPGRARLRWAVGGSTTLIPTGFMFSRAMVGASAAEQYTPLTLWNRDGGGGIPFETNDGGVYQETFDTTRAYFSLASTNPRYTNASWVHAPATTNGGVSTTDVSLVLGEIRPAAAKTVAARRALGIDTWTEQPFNIWEDATTPMVVRTQLSNGAAAAVTAAVTFWAKDFGGALVADETVQLTIPAGGVVDHAFTVAQPREGITFVEVKAVHGADEALARTTLAILTPYSYQAGEASIFGISNYAWLHEPSVAAVVGLLQKIGVRRVRIAYAPGNPMGYTAGLSPQILDGAGIDHNTQLGNIPIDGTPAEGEAWAFTNTSSAIASGAKYFEVGNELNNPWMQGLKAQQYVDQALAHVRAQLTNAGSSMKILNAGTGGMDFVWIENLKNAGGWDLIDGLAIHPGRGNFTPDYAPDPAEWDPGANGKYWNFLGSLKKANEIIASYGGNKELWLTEAYACTRPNAWWNDTLRHAAENVILSIALALSQNVRGVNWYQLHDSVLFHPQEADPANPEYHYGLMNRDASAKPSLLAFATAARAFDQATFVREFAFADPEIHGLQFVNPDGLYLAVLWSRKDGYILNADHGNTSYYATPEAWVDPWPTKTTMTLPAVGSSVRQVDVIGNETVMPAVSGSVQLTLDGAPRLFWGLAADCDA
ncbi:hypothetical protein [Luethyella okanaganae]|uniref:Alpha-L-arabinofuranosidase n=1 Tax=Luethyella okanaganae TaxID=69372 RepID=A0ABW1VEK7_9MICO